MSRLTVDLLQLHNAIQLTLYNLKANFPGEALASAGVLAIARGGLLPATYVLHMLRPERSWNPLEVVKCSSYSGDNQQEVLHIASLPYGGFAERVPETLIIVDDLWDTGRTIMAVLRTLQSYAAKPKIYIVVPYIKQPWQEVVAALECYGVQYVAYGVEVDSREWIEFPYET